MSIELCSCRLQSALKFQRAGYNRQLGLSNEIFVLGDSAVLTVLGQVSFMPVLVLAARLCPEVRPASLTQLLTHPKQKLS